MGDPRQAVDAAQQRPTHQRADESLRLTLEAASDAIIAIDVEGRVLFANRRLLDLWRIPPDMAARGRRDEMFALGRLLLADPEEEDLRTARLHPDDAREHEDRIALADGRMLRRRSVPMREAGSERVIGRVWSFTDVTAEDRALADLDAAREAAEAASRAKSEFLSRMSHELRTPLNAILGFAQLLALDPSTPLSERQQQHVAQITRGGDHLLALIDQLLDLAQIEAGQMALRLETLDPAPLIDASFEFLRLEAQRRHLALHRVIGEPVVVHADALRLKQVLINLLANAVKYNRPYGQVMVTLAPTNDRVRIEVSDTGPGIAPSLLPRLFSPFDRLDAERGRIEGTGVGLAICRHLVEMMKGEIGVQSRLGEGSTFWFTLPQAATH